jgi:hypothetical protein
MYCNSHICIPFLKDLKSYFSPDESENISLHIMMAKLWGLMRKKGLVPDKFGRCSVLLSDLMQFTITGKIATVIKIIWNSRKFHV